MISAWPLAIPAYSGFQQLRVLVYALLFGTANAALVLVSSHALNLPLFMDTIGTLVSTALLGFWPGAVTAVTTHVVLEALRGITGSNSNLVWVICSFSSVITLALLIRYGMFETILHAVAATICIALINSISGALVAVLFFSGLTVHPVDYIVTAFLSLGQSLLSSAFWARIPINLIDKGIAVFITFWLKIIWERRRRGSGEDSLERS